MSWLDIRAEGRAVALHLLDVRSRGALAGAFTDPVELFEFLLGLRATLLVPDHAVEPFAEIVRSLNFRLAAGIDVRRTAGTVIARNRDGQGGRRITHPEQALLDGRRPTGRRRLAPAGPVLVLPSAGRPDDVRRALSSHLDVIRQYGHADIELVVADDARNTATARQLDAICAGAEREYGYRVTRFAEWNGDGTAGAKQCFRRTTLARTATAHHDTVRRIMAPGLPGTANAVFARFADRDIIWLEEDASPYALTEAGELPVDVPHVVDRVLYAAPVETRPFEGHLATYEDTGFERLGEPSTGPHDDPGMVHFHTCGHLDYRARVGHHLVLDEGTPAAVRGTLLAGGLPVERVLIDVPPSVSFRRWTSAFGTVVGFRADRLPGPPTMWATPIRLVDFAVGDLVQAHGVPGCVAGTALRHNRGEVTDSGRGELSAYVRNEELVWPLLQATREAFAEVPRTDYPAWLGAAAQTVRLRAERGGVVPTALTHALWSEHRADTRRTERSPHEDVRDYAGARRDQSWPDFHRQLDASARIELTNYAAQLHTWGALT